MSAAAVTTVALIAGFSYINDPRIIVDLAYHGDNNFIGRSIDGYEKNVGIFSTEATKALSKVQDELDTLKQGYALKILDAYRPTRAVRNFEAWAQDPHDNKMQHMYYPDLTKPQLFEQKYIMSKSRHSRGCAVDLTIVKVDPVTKQHTELDMGTIFDFFGEASHTENPNISATAKQNRQLLKDVMERYGFKNLHNEWWHYDFVNEPFPDTYFDFPVG